MMDEVLHQKDELKNKSNSQLLSESNGDNTEKSLINSFTTSMNLESNFDFEKSCDKLSDAFKEFIHTDNLFKKIEHDTYDGTDNFSSEIVKYGLLTGKTFFEMELGIYIMPSKFPKKQETLGKWSFCSKNLKLRATDPKSDQKYKCTLTFEEQGSSTNTPPIRNNIPISHDSPMIFYSIECDGCLRDYLFIDHTYKNPLNKETYNIALDFGKYSNPWVKQFFLNITRSISASNYALMKLDTSCRLGCQFGCRIQNNTFKPNFAPSQSA